MFALYPQMFALIGQSLARRVIQCPKQLLSDNNMENLVSVVFLRKNVCKTN